MEGGPQREGPVHLHPAKHRQERRDLALGTAAEEHLSTESNILLQSLRHGGEGWTSLSKQKGEQSAWHRAAAKLKQTPLTTSSLCILGTNLALLQQQRPLLASHPLYSRWTKFRKNLTEEV